MKTNRAILGAAMLAACMGLPTIQVSGQESSGNGGSRKGNEHPMLREVIDMQKTREMASPSMMKQAKEQMLAGQMMPKAMAMEMSMAMVMRDDKTMKMVQDHTKAMMPNEQLAFSEEQIKAAIRKIFRDPAQFQSMLQTLIMRETAVNMMMGDKKKPAADMMMIPEADMKTAMKGMMGDEAMIMRLAREMMMNAMMMDNEISMAVKEAAMKHSDPATQQMMNSERMMMASEQLMKEPSMKMEMAKEAMVREMAKPSEMMPDKQK